VVSPASMWRAPRSRITVGWSVVMIMPPLNTVGYPRSIGNGENVGET
jgi:hypothetical protein